MQSELSPSEFLRRLMLPTPVQGIHACYFPDSAEATTAALSMACIVPRTVVLVGSPLSRCRAMESAVVQTLLKEQQSHVVYLDPDHLEYLRGFEIDCLILDTDFRWSLNEIMGHPELNRVPSVIALRCHGVEYYEP